MASTLSMQWKPANARPQPQRARAVHTQGADSIPLDQAHEADEKPTPHKLGSLPSKAWTLGEHSSGQPPQTGLALERADAKDVSTHHVSGWRCSGGWADQGKNALMAQGEAGRLAGWRSPVPWP